jgi:hypothetical protein
LRHSGAGERAEDLGVHVDQFTEPVDWVPGAVRRLQCNEVYDPAGRLIAETVRTRYGASILQAPPGVSDGSPEDCVIYQEDHRYLDVLLGADSSDPIGHDPG